MARIAGVDIPRDKRVDISLRYIYGIGPAISSTICQSTRVEPATKVRDLTDDEINRIREFIDRNFVVEGELRKSMRTNIQRLVEINCYAACATGAHVGEASDPHQRSHQAAPARRSRQAAAVAEARQDEGDDGGESAGREETARQNAKTGRKNIPVGKAYISPHSTTL
jgi:small subunit ribosomal protein S13